jgi:hypothetical protein
MIVVQALCDGVFRKSEWGRDGEDDSGENDRQEVICAE